MIKVEIFIDEKPTGKYICIDENELITGYIVVRMLNLDEKIYIKEKSIPLMCYRDDYKSFTIINFSSSSDDTNEIINILLKYKSCENNKKDY